MKVENIKRLIFTKEEVSILTKACKIIEEVASELEDDYLANYEDAQYILDIIDATMSLEC